MTPVDSAALRVRLTHVLRLDVQHEAPLHVMVLAALYMNWPDEVAANLLYDALDRASEAEQVDVDEVLNGVAMIEALS